MTWTAAFQIVSAFFVSVGGAGLVLFGLSRFLGEIWLQGMKGDIDAKLHRLDAALKHRNFLLQRVSEYELEALVECWRAARACLPLINNTRPLDSGTDEDVLAANWKLLSDAHNKLIDAIGRHEPFLSKAIVDNLDEIGRIVRGELSGIRYHEHFKGDWWKEGEKSRNEFAASSAQLKKQVMERIAELRAESKEDRDQGSK